MRNINKILTTDKAAEFLGVKPKTLQVWRSKGEGPKFYEPRPRVIRYQESELIKWIESSMGEVENV